MKEKHGLAFRPEHDAPPPTCSFASRFSAACRPRFIDVGPQVTREGWWVIVSTSACSASRDVCLPSLPSTFAQGLIVPAEEPVLDTASTLHELRRLTGLTWSKLAECFGVRRRSLHLWASGGGITEKHEAKLRALVDAMRYVDRGAADANRALLLQPRRGQAPFRLLVEGELDALKASLGRGEARRAPVRSVLSSEEARRRVPPPPDAFIEPAGEAEGVREGRGKALRLRRRRG